MASFSDLLGAMLSPVDAVRAQAEAAFVTARDDPSAVS